MADLPARKDTILDIDLDYFSCAGKPVEDHPVWIEINKSEFDKFNRNPYHLLKYSGVSKD